MTRTQKEKMLAGEMYNPADEEIQMDLLATGAWLKRYNDTLGSTAEHWNALLLERLGEVGTGAVIRPPFHCDYGFNIRLGAYVYINFNCVILDVAEVTIGAGTAVGPAVQIYTADHPHDPEQRQAGLQLGRPVRIGKDVWIGGGAIILPGVTIGDNAVIGAGSVVTRDIPAGEKAMGNPARLKR
ncbi:sugar O-acetyltransferase (plasmid) [Rhizobium ruizarguesonis]|jgi:maltose O-acetyltransferase|uniref:Nodulation protein L n=5 Tax=Rhizobium TaxID=379 RepID=A0A1B8R8S8_RHILT|nr:MULTISPECIES: sugar O-acetyltransferase [Rhizobium]AOO92037.1 maltose O-acetyltransferase [Rhizobium leguminosarum bv. trifolii]OBY05167.1 maltose acetyltransferase [Rhizobium leguminosarum bv. trifolii]TAU15602.1 sugar O-acetyltransferase [Rhizobium ruizarguesonis]TAU37081.1 sugar O-acetyltransferase [Rhizobium leguminosarum]TAU37457.1 sugar O-acetyltransferase [Rhizobium ruizarguesonis]